VALWVTTLVVSGIEVTGATTARRVVTIVVVALIFGLVNAILKPVIRFVGCFLYVFTLGLFGLVVNALLFLLTDWLAGLLDLPFDVTGFWPAFWGAIVMTIVSWVLSLVVPDGDKD
jgi:putative membrane protein